MVDVAVRDEHRPGVSRTQAQMADGSEDQGTVGRVAAVDDQESRFVADHDPIRRRSLNEKDTGGRLGRAGGGLPLMGSRFHMHILAT